MSNTKDTNSRRESRSLLGMVVLLAATAAIAEDPRLSTTSSDPTLELGAFEISFPGAALLNHAVFVKFAALGPEPEGRGPRIWLILYLRCGWDARGVCHETSGYVSVTRGRRLAHLGRLESADLVMLPDDDGVRASGRLVFELREAQDPEKILEVVFSLDDIGFVEDKDAMADIAHPAVVRQFSALADWAKEIGVVSPDDPSAFE